MKKKELTIIAEKLYGGGVERILQIICRNFDYERYDVTLYTITRTTPDEINFPRQLRYRYVFDTSSNTDSIGRKLWVRLKNKMRLMVYYHTNPRMFNRLFIHDCPDVVVAFIEGYATRLAAGYPNSVKKIAWLHIELENFHWTKVAYRSNTDEKVCYQTVNRIVCVANQVKEQIDRMYDVGDKTIVVHNPIDRNFVLRAAQEPLSEQFARKSFPIRLISVGSLTERKAHDRLLHIVKRLRDEGIDVELWILGEGEKQQELERYIADNHLSDRITLLGFQENPFCYVKAADIYVCPSCAEGYNTAITEALVLGKAVVSTECSGVKEQLGEHNDYGICTANNEEALYKGIRQMLSSDTLSYYTRKAKERGQIFTLERSMKKIYELLDA